jgi:hypothetical protein
MFRVKWRSVAIERNLRGAGVRWRARQSRDGAQAGGVRKIQTAVSRDRPASRTLVARQEGLSARFATSRSFLPGPSPASRRWA